MPVVSLHPLRQPHRHDLTMCFIQILLVAGVNFQQKISNLQKLSVTIFIVIRVQIVVLGAQPSRGRIMDTTLPTYLALRLSKSSLPTILPCRCSFIYPGRASLRPHKPHSTMSSHTSTALQTRSGASHFLKSTLRWKTGCLEICEAYFGVAGRRLFAGMLSAVDEGVGNVTKTLRAKNMWPSTVFIVTTDNGAPITECGGIGGSNVPLRGCSEWC